MRGSKASLRISLMKCTSMTQTARIMTIASTTGTSRCPMETISSRPMPGTEKICSMTMQPASISAALAARKVMTGSIAFFRAWAFMAVRRLMPLA